MVRRKVFFIFWGLGASIICLTPQQHFKSSLMERVGLKTIFKEERSHVVNNKMNHSHFTSNDSIEIFSEKRTKKNDLPQILYYLKEDRCFCIKNSTLYDNRYENELFGVPEEDITGKHDPLEIILEKVKSALNEETVQKGSSGELFIMRIVVNKEGIVKCGIALKGDDERIFEKAFELLRKEEYKPAKFRGKPADWHFYFVFRP